MGQELIIMKLGLCISIGILAGALTGAAQNQPTNSPPIQGSAAGQVPGQTQIARPSQFGATAGREQRYYGGVVRDITKGRLLTPPPETHPRSPAQNPAVDMRTGRPRGIVLWSWNY